MKATGRKHSGFPTTDWSGVFSDLRGSADVRNTALNLLIATYWRPVYFYLLRKGSSSEDAKDLTQEFF